jgi:hypothetical protein
MSDAIEAPTLTVRGRTITGKFLTTREARPLMARMKDASNDWLEWIDTVFDLMTEGEDREFLAGVPTAEIGVENVQHFFIHGGTGVKPPKPLIPEMNISPRGSEQGSALETIPTSD